MKLRQIILQILSRNHLSYVAILNDLCDIESKIKVTQFELGLWPSYGQQFFLLKFSDGRTRNLILCPSNLFEEVGDKNGAAHKFHAIGDHNGKTCIVLKMQYESQSNKILK